MSRHEGFQIFNTDGTIKVDVSDNLTGFIATFETGTKDGEFSLPNGKYRTWWGITDATGYNPFDFGNAYEIPKITVTDNKFKWKFETQHNRCNICGVIGFY